MKIRVRLRDQRIDGTMRVCYGRVCVGSFASIPNPEGHFRAIWFLDKAYPVFTGTREDCLIWFETMTLDFLNNFLVTAGESDADDPRDTDSL